MASTVTLPRTRRTAPAGMMTPARVRAIVDQAIADAHAERKIAEDKRAAKRNRNRVYMLLVTIANTFATVGIMDRLGYHSVLVAFPMFPIVVGLMLDMILACWSWWRKL